MKRVNFGFFSQWEEKFLWGVVKKIPSWITPDMLSFSAFFAFIFSGLIYYLAGKNLNLLWLINFLIFYHWLADGLDGKLAKFRGKSRPNYGYYLDHLLDSTAVTGVILGIYFSPLTDTFWAIIFLSLILLLMINAYLIHSVSKVFYLSYGKIGGTEGRFLLIIFNILIWFLKNKKLTLFKFNLSLADWVFFVSSLFLLIIFLTSFFKNISYLKKEKFQF
ncbi:MAG: hypothetical protein ACPLKP_02125 [Microgenomates group bacterium]